MNSIMVITEVGKLNIEKGLKQQNLKEDKLNLRKN